jgi:hypothetical protein
MRTLSKASKNLEDVHQSESKKALSQLLCTISAHKATF